MIGKLKFATIALAGFAMLSLASPAAAQGAQCSRDTLQDVANRYVKAQHDGSVLALPVGEWVDYRENYELGSTDSGVIGQPADFAWHLDLIDTGNCRVFVEGVILKPKPYVVDTRMAWSFNGLGQIGSIVTHPGDAGFDAQKTYDTASKEDWSAVAADKRASRDDLMAAAKAYLATQPALTDPEFTVDETKNAVAVRGQLGGPDGPAVSHVMRIEGGKVSYVHSMTGKGVVGA